MLTVAGGIVIAVVALAVLFFGGMLVLGLFLRIFETREGKVAFFVALAVIGVGIASLLTPKQPPVPYEGQVRRNATSDCIMYRNGTWIAVDNQLCIARGY